MLLVANPKHTVFSQQGFAKLEKPTPLVYHRRRYPPGSMETGLPEDTPLDPDLQIPAWGGCSDTKPDGISMFVLSSNDAATFAHARVKVSDDLPCFVSSLPQGNDPDLVICERPPHWIPTPAEYGAWHYCVTAQRPCRFSQLDLVARCANGTWQTCDLRAGALPAITLSAPPHREGRVAQWLLSCFIDNSRDFWARYEAAFLQFNIGLTQDPLELERDDVLAWLQRALSVALAANAVAYLPEAEELVRHLLDRGTLESTDDEEDEAADHVEPERYDNNGNEAIIVFLAEPLNKPVGKSMAPRPQSHSLNKSHVAALRDLLLLNESERRAWGDKARYCTTSALALAGWLSFLLCE